MNAFELGLDSFEVDSTDDEYGGEEAALLLGPETDSDAETEMEFDPDPETEFDFDELESGLEDPEWEQEFRRRGRGLSRSGIVRRGRPTSRRRFRRRIRRPVPRPGSRPRPRPRPRPGRPRRRLPLLRRRFPARRRCPACNCPAQGTEYVRWVQSSLNHIGQSQLAVNGIMSPQARDALRDFQQRQGLIADGIAGPETQQALMAARAGGAPASPPGEEPRS